MSKRSRFYKNLEKKSQRTFILSILGIAIIVILLIRYGIPFLANLSFNVDKFTGRAVNSKVIINSEFLSAPAFDPLPVATNSSNLKITGSGSSGKTLEIYVNGQKFDEKEIDSSGYFSSAVKLTEGENIIKAKIIDQGKSSDFSDSFSITYKRGQPRLEIENPADGSTTSSKDVEVHGKTDDGNKVTVNGFWAITEGENFTYKLTLSQGDNEITINTQDNAGNMTEKKIKITYSP